MQQQLDAKKEECDMLAKEMDSLRLRLIEQKTNEVVVERKDSIVSVSTLFTSKPSELF